MAPTIAPYLKIVIDFDGTIADFHGALIAAVGPPDSLAGWGFEEWYKDPKQVAASEAFTADPASYSTLRPVDGARKALRLLAGAGHQLYGVTARPVEAQKETFEWVDRWFRRVFREVHVVGPRDKISTITSLFPHMVVDDSQKLVEALREKGINAVIFNQPWNQTCEGPRAMSWLHLRKVMGV